MFPLKSTTPSPNRAPRKEKGSIATPSRNDKYLKEPGDATNAELVISSTQEKLTVAAGEETAQEIDAALMQP